MKALHIRHYPKKISINKGETKNIGIVLDADEEGISAKIENKINPAIEKAFGLQHHIKSTNVKFPIEFGGNIVNIFCYLFNIDGKGELEDILKEIRTDKNTETPRCLGGCPGTRKYTGVGWVEERNPTLHSV